MGAYLMLQMTPDQIASGVYAHYIKQICIILFIFKNSLLYNVVSFSEHNCERPEGISFFFFCNSFSMSCDFYGP